MTTEQIHVMQKAIAYAIVRIDQGLDDFDVRQVREECAIALAGSLGITIQQLGTPDLSLYNRRD